MHIAFVTNEFVSEGGSFDGGLSNYLYNISQTLIQNGHRVSVFVTSSDKIEHTEYHNISVFRVHPPNNSIWLDLLNKILFSKYYLLLYNIFLSYQLNKKLRQVSCKMPIDIIQYANIRGLALFKPKHIPGVIRCSSYRRLIDEAQDLHFNTFRKRQVQWLEDFVLRRCENIYAPSKLIADVVGSELHKQVAVIETLFLEKKDEELDYEILNEVRQRTSSNPYLLYYGRLGTWKGTVELANVLYDFLKENPDVYFVLVGKDKGYKGKPMMNYLLEKAGQYSSRIIYYPNLRQEQLFPIIDGAHDVVLPSRIENLSNACIESMARGKVVLGTNGASYEQLITDGVNGFLFEKMNEADLLRKMNVLAKLDDNRIAELGKAAKEAVKRLHPNVIYDQLIGYYEKVIKSHHSQ